MISSINILLAPIGGIIFVMIDYVRNRSTDQVQRKIVLLIMISTLLAILCELTYDACKGTSLAYAHNIAYLSNLGYLIFQVSAFGAVALFLDHMIHHDSERLKKLIKIIALINFLNITILIGNGFNASIFFITSNNFYVKGDLYIIRLLISYFIAAVAFADILIGRKKVNKTFLALFVLFSLPVIVGATLDLLIFGSRLAWPCFSLSLLFAYLFIVRLDYRLDGITGLYTRRYCDEYLLSIVKTGRRKRYSFIMVDIDQFKQINDTFGHSQGDNALRDVADILKRSVRHSDFIARYGGDEFLIISTTQNANEIVSRINHTLEEFNAGNKRAYQIGLSCGCGDYESDEIQTIKHFIDHVDGLMYRNKGERRKERIED